jgi:hypothetical protein
MSAAVAGIFVAPEGGAALIEIREAILDPGRGIVGDRYHSGAGTFWKKLQKTGDWEITLIESEEIARFNASQQVALAPGSFRRNVVTRGIRLNDLVDRRFTVGDVELEGIRLCEPCTYLARRLGPAVIEQMVHRAGLRARILTGGAFRPGDAILAAGANE